MDRSILVIVGALLLVSVVLMLQGCAFGVMPDTSSRQFWADRDARIATW